MKKYFIAFVVLMASLPTFAQYMPVDGTLSKKGTRLFAEGRKLTKGEIAATLSMFSDDKGIGYDLRWTNARRGYNAGIALTTIGSVAGVAGGLAAGYGLVAIVGTGMVAPLLAVAGEDDELDIAIQRAGTIFSVGIITGVCGFLMLGAGIPLLCVYNVKMKKIVRGYNSQYSNSTSDVTLNFGPTRNGVGLALNF